MDEAIRVFSERGYHGTSIGDLTEAMGFEYRAWNALDILSSNTVVDAIHVHGIVLEGDPQSLRITFRADLEFHVTLNYSRDIHQAAAFPGVVSRRIESDGIIVDDVTADTSGQYE